MPVGIRVSGVFALGLVVIEIHISEGIVLTVDGIREGIPIGGGFLFRVVGIGIHISEGMSIGISVSGGFVLRLVGIGIHISEGIPIGIRMWGGVFFLGSLNHPMVVGIRIGIRVIGGFWRRALIFLLHFFHVPSEGIKIHVGEGISISVIREIPVRVSGGPHVFVLGVC